MEAVKKYSLTIYGDYFSQPARSVMAFCTINKIPYKFKLVNLTKGEHLTENYKKINQFGKIPAIVIKNENTNEEFTLGESCTILRFLSDLYKVDNKWYPRDDIYRRANVDQWLDWHHLNTRFSIMNYVFRKVFSKKFEKKGIIRPTQDTDSIIPKVLGFLDKVLQKRKFLVDDEVSIADLIISSEINQLRLTDYDTSKYTALNDYLYRVNSIHGVKEVNQAFADLAKKVKMQFNDARF